MVKYLESPKGFKAHVLSPIRGVINFVAIACPILVINVLQVLTLLIRPFSGAAFRRINREFANFWWGMIVFMMERVYRMEMVFTGCQLPQRENAIVISNHQGMIDIPALLPPAWRKRRLGDMKYFVKDILKYAPGPGWGMVFLGCIFIKRDWYADKNKIDKVFAKIKKYKIPIWLMSFLEGTRVTDAKVKKSQDFARSRGLKELKHVLIPRTKGFVGAIRGLGDHVDAVYDFTIGYPDGVPSLWQFMQGHAKAFHVHIERFSIAELPVSEEALTAWVFDRYHIKDELLAEFHRKLAFPGPRIIEPYSLCP
jgi:1-acyl-sn-glycerol-3-phosphate acyltransferase